MNIQIKNLLEYYFGLFNDHNEDNKSGKFARSINSKSKYLKENLFESFLFSHTWVNPIDILIISINYFEKIKKKHNMNDCNAYGILWILCILASKYTYSYDNDEDISIEYLSNLGGFLIEDYISFEKQIVYKLDWKLEITDEDYTRLNNIHNCQTCEISA